VGAGLASALRTGAWPAGCELVLPEVQSDSDLDGLAAALSQPGPRTLWCGSAGLAAAIARQRGVPDSAVGAAAVAPVGPVWVIGASHQAVARRQWARAAVACPGATAVRHGDAGEFEVALRDLATGAARLALLDLAPLESLSPADAAALLQTQVALLAALPRQPVRLLVLGGDTARALARAAGVTHLLSGSPVRPGWGQAVWCGGRWDGLWMDCRSGAFGDDDDLISALGHAVFSRMDIVRSSN
jgi:D-threonate/D-erythronate kinase